MILIKTYIEKSVIHGIGLYADEPISKGQVIAKLNHLDVLIDASKVAPKHKEFFDFYFSLHDGYYQSYVDNMRFMNHAQNPNCIDTSDGATVAIKDIKKGEELTCDYSLICELWKQSK